MRWKPVITVLAGCLLFSGCKHFTSASYSGPLADFAKKIDPVYSNYVSIYSQEKEARQKGDVQKVMSLDMQGEAIRQPLTDAIDEAMKTEKGKEIPFTQTGNQDKYTVTKIVFSGAFEDRSAGDVYTIFQAEAILKSPDERWKTETWKFVNKKGEVLTEGKFTNSSGAKSGPVTFHGDFEKLSDIDKNLDRIIIP
jgi:hypothetical protein